MAASAMIVLAISVHVAGAAMVRFFSSDPAVIAVGDEYLRIVSWSFAASGIIFVTSSMFQAMGNTMPSLISSFTRLVVVSIPVLLLAQAPGFQLWWVWYISVSTIVLPRSASCCCDASSVSGCRSPTPCRCDVA
jgi:Na+-driven multidrug efflux pump